MDPAQTTVTPPVTDTTGTPPAAATPPATPPATPAAPDAGAPPASTADASSAPPNGGTPLTTERIQYQLPDGVPSSVADWANTHKLSQDQLNASLHFFGNVSQAQAQAQQQQLRLAGEAHIKNWGENRDYNLKLAQRALRQNDPNGALTKALNETGYGNHPAVLDFLLNLGKSMQEGGFLKSGTSRPPGSKSAAQAMYGDNHPSIEE